MDTGRERGRSRLPFTIRGFGLGLVSLLATQASVLLVDAVVARRHGASGLGLVALGANLAALLGATIVTGWASGVASSVAHADGVKHAALIRGQILLGIAGAAIGGALAATAVVAGADYLSGTLSGGKGAAEVIAWFGLSLPFQAVASVASASATALRMLRVEAGQRVVEAGVRLLAVPALLFAAASPRDVAVIFVVASAAAVPASLIPLARALPLFDRHAPTEYDPRKLLTFAGGQTVASAAWSVGRRVDVLIISSVLGASAVGVYRLCNTLASSAGLILAGLQSVFLAIAARRAAGEGGPALLDHYRRVTRFAMLTSAPLIAVWLVAPERILGVFGAVFVPGAMTLVILALAYGVLVVGGHSTTVVLIAGDSRTAAMNTAIAVGVQVAALLALVPAYGIGGAAIASLLAFLTLHVLQVHRVGQLLGASLLESRWVRVLALLMALVLTSLGTGALAPWPTSVAVFLGSLLVYVPLAIRHGLPAGEREVLRELRVSR